MKHCQSFFGPATLALLLGTTAAQAEVTAAQVWKNWQDYSAGMGLTMTAGSEAMEGDTLVVRDIATTVGESEVTATGTIAELRLKELGDGTVEATMSPDFPIVFKGASPEGKTFESTLLVTAPDIKTIVSGSDGEWSYDFAAPSIGITVDGVQADGKPVDLQVAATMADVTGSYKSTLAEARTVTGDMTTGAFSFTLAAKNPEGTGTLNVVAAIDKLASTGTTVMPLATDGADMKAMLDQGFSTDSTMTFGTLTYDIDLQDGPEVFKGVGETSEASLGVVMDKARLGYFGGSKATKLDVTAAQIPFPVSLTIAEHAFDVLIPVAKSDTPQDFRFVMKVIDLALNEEIWGLFDPGAVLPRDPATLILDTNGSAKVFFDMLAADPATPPPVPPGELNALTVNALQAKVAGADLTGNGAFTFDNTDLTTFDGMPRPLGKLNVQLVGGNALLDKLVQMGFVPEDQAMGARMMLGLFARPGEGPDTLVSEIEVKEDGSVLANGQRIR